jgi:ribosomal protein S18 acetylase RimI-like enzyme
MDPPEIVRIAEINRSEHVTTRYSYENGKLRAEQVDWHVPRWRRDGGDFSVEALIEQFAPVLGDGGVMLGAFEGSLLVGFAILRYRLTERQAQLVALYVSRGYRRQGIATRLTSRIARLAKADGAEELYVSVTPSESAVGFYMSHGFRLAEAVNDALYALEPEDIHMIRWLG